MDKKTKNSIDRRLCIRKVVEFSNENETYFPLMPEGAVSAFRNCKALMNSFEIKGEGISKPNLVWCKGKKKKTEVPSPQTQPFQKPSPEIQQPTIEPGKVPLQPKPEISPTPGPPIEPTKTGKTDEYSTYSFNQKQVS